MSGMHNGNRVKIAIQYAFIYSLPAHNIIKERPKTVKPDTTKAIIIYCNRPTRINNSVSSYPFASFTTIPVILGIKTPEIDVERFITILLNVPPTL